MFGVASSATYPWVPLRSFHRSKVLSPLFPEQTKIPSAQQVWIICGQPTCRAYMLHGFAMWLLVPSQKNPPACRRVWLEGVVLVSVLGFVLVPLFSCFAYLASSESRSPPLWARIPALRGPRSSYKILQRLLNTCVNPHRAQHFSLLAMQASLEPRSGSGCELSSLMPRMPNYTCIV